MAHPIMGESGAILDTIAPPIRKKQQHKSSLYPSKDTEILP